MPPPTGILWPCSRSGVRLLEVHEVSLCLYRLCSSISSISSMQGFAIGSRSEVAPLHPLQSRDSHDQKRGSFCPSPRRLELLQSAASWCLRSMFSRTTCCRDLRELRKTFHSSSSRANKRGPPLEKGPQMVADLTPCVNALAADVFWDPHTSIVAEPVSCVIDPHVDAVLEPLIHQVRINSLLAPHQTQIQGPFCLSHLAS